MVGLRTENIIIEVKKLRRSEEQIKSKKIRSLEVKKIREIPINSIFL
jgi:hypothetical protein